MTIICDFCGCENHLDADFCEECGKPIKKDQVYVVCSICGISNPNTAATCIACGEPLDKTFVINKEEAEKEPILSEEASGVVKKPVPKKDKKKKKLGFIKWIILAVAVLSIIVLIIFNLYQPMYLTPHTGYYYTTEIGNLRYLDQGDDELLLESSQGVERVEKYGKNVYFISGESLYYHDHKSSYVVANDVVDFKVDYYGKRVLYLTAKEDLYLYEKGESKRIDAKVAIERYIFSELDDTIYYVTDLTDENLGTLHKKFRDNPSEIVCEDVYKPILNLSKGQVHFVRENITFGDPYDLFLAKNGKITEVARNIDTLYFNPKDKYILGIQTKNNNTAIIKIESDEIEIIDDNIGLYGRRSFNDTVLPFNVTDRLQLFYVKNKENYIYDEEITKLPQVFEEFYFSDKYIYTIHDGEFMISEFDGSLNNTISLDSQVDLKVISESGQAVIYEVDGRLYFVHDGYKQVLPSESSNHLITDNDRYIVYLLDGRGFVYKVGANEPVDLGKVEGLYTNGKYVYTIVEGGLFRYKLGKFSSNELIEKTEELIPFELSF